MGTAAIHTVSPTYGAGLPELAVEANIVRAIRFEDIHGIMHDAVCPLHSHEQASLDLTQPLCSHVF